MIAKPIKIPVTGIMVTHFSLLSFSLNSGLSVSPFFMRRERKYLKGAFREESMLKWEIETTGVLKGLCGLNGGAPASTLMLRFRIDLWGLLRLLSSKGSWKATTAAGFSISSFTEDALLRCESVLDTSADIKGDDTILLALR